MRNEDIKHVVPETIVVASGATLNVIALPGQLACTAKWLSGGSMLIVSPGFTSVYSLANNSLTHDQGITQIGSSFAYLVSTNEIINADFSGRDFWVAAVGATLIMNILRYIGEIV